MSEPAAAGIVFTERDVEFRKWPAKAYVPTWMKPGELTVKGWKIGN